MTYFVAPLLHALKVAAFILAVNVILGLVIGWVTEERFIRFMERGLFVQPLITSLIGLIPQLRLFRRRHRVLFAGRNLLRLVRGGGCAPTRGMGFVVLLKNTKKWKRNLVLIGRLLSHFPCWWGSRSTRYFPARRCKRRQKRANGKYKYNRPELSGTSFPPCGAGYKI